MPKQTLVADIEAFVQKSEARLLTVMRDSILDTVNESQKPVGEGGRMRVDTGFLRASGRASLDGMPSGRGEKNAAERAVEGMHTGQFDTFEGKSVVSTLLTMKLGDTFTFGWVANYAEIRELYDGFLITATQNWQINVNRNSEKFKGR